MATPIPAFVSQVYIDASTDSFSVNSATTLATTRYYYLVSNRTTASDGQSLLHALSTALGVASTNASWTVKLATSGSTAYNVQFSHTSTGSLTITWTDSSLATYLGLSTASTVVAASTTVTAPYPSVWWWSPNMPISETGPQMFDPAISHGVPESPGSAHRAPDGTPIYTENGTLFACDLVFRGVEAYYRIKPTSGHTNQDLHTWWTNGPRKGRRFLWWRDRDDAAGSASPSEGTATPYNYVELAPNAEMRARLPAAPLAPPNLVWWDVQLGAWVTENGETPLTD